MDSPAARKAGHSGRIILFPTADGFFIHELIKHEFVDRLPQCCFLKEGHPSQALLADNRSGKQSGMGYHGGCRSGSFFAPWSA